MIVVLNFGSQFAHLIARRVRDLGVKAEIVPFDTSAEVLRAIGPSGIIFSGGPRSVLEKGAPLPDKRIFDVGVPILGICYGHQVMAHMLGGKVEKGKYREFGKEVLKVGRGSIFKGLAKSETVWFSHGDQAKQLPKGFVRIASTRTCKNAAFAHEKRRMWGIQFHPEVSHTVHGTRILGNFLAVCKAPKDWNMRSVAHDLIAEIKRDVGDNHVLIGLSGGVDSLVAATLIYRAIGNRLHAVFVDTGLMRKNEVTDVAATLRKRGFRGLHVIDAAHLFLSRLKGESDPEKKRKSIGHTFIEVFEKAAKSELKRHRIGFFAQGTIYSDRVESAGATASSAKIKTHHNLALPEKMGFTLLEPLKDLYKDEVRAVGLSLGLPKDLVFRHPFPGPGLAVRIVGEVTPERLRIVREAEDIFIRALKKHGEYGKIWMAFAALFPIKVTGVMGDARTHEYVIALRAVDSTDVMTADWHKIPFPLLEKISSEIVNGVHGVNRVVYDVTQKPPATMEYE